MLLSILMETTEWRVADLRAVETTVWCRVDDVIARATILARDTADTRGV